MGRKLLELVGFVAISLLWLTAAGCAESAVGDPCVPESVPPGGFLASETYLESNSVQCATRTCLVRELKGDPRNLKEDDCPRDVEGEPSTCVLASEVDRKVYCSCRCGAPEGSGIPTCGCPSGFICEPVLETGGDGIRGSYCVKDPVLAAE